MKILFFCHKIIMGGGTEKFLLSILEVLKDKHIDITLVLLEKDGVLEPELPSDVNIKYLTNFEEFRSLIYVPSIALLQKLIHRKEFWKAFRQFSTYIRIN